MSSRRRRRRNRHHHRRHRYRRNRPERSTSTTSDATRDDRHARHWPESSDDSAASAAIDEFQVRINATFVPEFDAELDRLVAAAHEHIIDEEYPDEQWGPRMEHELRTAIRRMVVMNTPAEEIYHTLCIAEFDELSRQSQQNREQDQQQASRNETDPSTPAGNEGTSGGSD